MAILGQLGVKLTAETAEFQRKMKDVKKSVSGFEDVAKSAAKGLGIAFAGLAGSLTVAVRAADKQRQAEIKLASALKATGASFSVQSIKDYAGELQKLTTFGDEATIEAAAMLQTFKLTEDQLKALLPAAQNFAAATGVDLRTAALTLGKALDGSVGQLSRYGVTLSDAEKATFKLGDRQERVAIITQGVAKNYGDVAQALTGTTLGAFQQFSNEVGDLTEEFGELLSPSLVPFFKSLTDVAMSLKQVFQGLSGETKSFIGIAALVATAVAGIGAALAAIAAVLPSVVAGFSLMATTALPALVPVAAAIAAIAATIGGVVLLVGIFKRAWDSNLGGIQDSINRWINSAQLAFQGFFMWLTDSWNKITKTISDTAIDLFVFVSGGTADEAFELKQALGGSLGDDIKNAILEPVKFAADGIKSGAMELVDTLSVGASAIGDLLAPAVKGAKDQIDNLLGSGSGLESGLSVPQLLPSSGAGGGLNVSAPEAFQQEVDFDRAFGDSSIYDEMEQNAERQAAALNQAGLTLVGGLGDTGQLIASTVNAFNNGGPFAAAANIFASLVVETESFQRIVEALQPVFEALVGVLEPILPIIELFLVPQLELIGKVLRQVARFISAIVRGVAEAFIQILRFIDKVTKGIDFDDEISGLEQLKRNARVGVEEQSEASSAIQDQDLPTFYDALKESLSGTTDGLDNLATTVNNLNSSLTNVPQGFKVAAARFNAEDAATGRISGAASSGSARHMVVNFNGMTVDEAFVKIRELEEERGFAQRGTIADTAPQFLNENRRTPNNINSVIP